MTDAERTLIHEALRFAVWAAGEGIAPTKGEDARDPEDFLFDYSLETDETDWETLPDRIIAALEAQLAERVQVKPLVWRGTEGVWAKADALFGATYRITDYAGMAKPFKLETVGFVGPNGHYGTLDEAKAAAQADYERRILSALEATPAPMVNRHTHCGGCGETDPAKFCTGCLENFGPASHSTEGDE